MASLTERRRQRADAADRVAFQAWARRQLEKYRFQPTRSVASNPTPAGDREATAWWTGLAEMAACYRRLEASLERQRVELRTHAPQCPTCGAKWDAEAVLAEQDAELAHIAEIIRRYGWIPEETK